MSPVRQRIAADVDLARLFGNGRRPLGVRNLGEILPGQSYTRTPPVFLERAGVTPAMAAVIDDLFEETIEPALPLHLLAITQALVFGQGSVALPDGRLLHESAREFVNFGLVPEGTTTCSGGWRLDRPISGRLGGTTLLVKRPWYRNYGHWLVDLLPIVPLVARHGFKPDTILFGDAADPQLRDMMVAVATEFMPGAETIFADDETPLLCETLLYVTPTHIPPVFKHPFAMQVAAEAGFAVVGGEPDAAAPRRKLYVSRQKAAARRLHDGEAAEAVLRDAGFETFFAEDATFAEKVAAFAAASAVVGVKGAGLSNVLFSQPGTELLVLSPGDFPDPFFWDLATQRGLRYAEIFCPTLTTPDASTGRSDFEADVGALARYLAGERRVPNRSVVRRRSFWRQRKREESGGS